MASPVFFYDLLTAEKGLLLPQILVPSTKPESISLVFIQDVIGSVLFLP